MRREEIKGIIRKELWTGKTRIGSVITLQISVIDTIVNEDESLYSIFIESYDVG